MSKKTGEDRTCRACGKTFYVSGYQIRNGEGVFCSRACRRNGEQRACRYCGKSFYAERNLIEKGGGLYCSHRCYSLAKPNPLQVLVCEQCGARREFRSGVRVGRFCSIACSAAAQRTGPAIHPCEVCGQSVKHGERRFCSKECGGIGRRRRALVRCPRCGTEHEKRRSAIGRGRRYCSWACYIGEGGARDITCEMCGKVRHTYAANLKRGGGRFCSPACYHASQRRQTVCCQVCHRWIRPTKASQRFCSISCANRARSRPHPEERRNARVWELHQVGFKAPGIQVLLVEKNPGWWMSEANIRKVISRQRALLVKKKQPRRRKRSVTLLRSHPDPSPDPAPSWSAWVDRAV